MSPLAGALRLRRMMRRGGARLLMLDALTSKPMHGYEVGKAISAKFQEAYEPSPGVIYPTLQSLQDEGYVEGATTEGKTVYTITLDGRSFLQKNAESLAEVIRFVQAAGDEFPITKSATRLVRTVRLLAPELSKESRFEVAKILDEATERVKKLAD
jgi:DNA-binding PadR family transcriptional regulator